MPSLLDPFDHIQQIRHQELVKVIKELLVLQEALQVQSTHGDFGNWS